MFVLIADVEELRLALTVVCGDEVADDFRQIVFVGHLQTLGDVANDILCRLNICEHFVGVDARLVFGEIDGVGEFTDVMIQGTRTNQL